ncbi:protein FAR1-RELATED SEQUENCE 2-like [Bidens hawaiensis]|uniref:protein FAR1-RELATED SEQUENCE 2-like n=1 Tax=Bidens hawaiensis TaxID=980011 RepID=UPI0040499489
MEDDREIQRVDSIPEVASSYRLVKGMMFSSIDQAFDFYSEYAKKAGFGVRKGGSYLHDGVLKTKYFTCCKECLKPAKMYASKVHDFVEGHNHSMVADSDMQFIRSARKLTHVQEEAIYELSNLNPGPYDAEMIVLRLCAKKTFSSNYSFEYDVNDDRELIRMFWSDEISKSNYLAFGDIISFDATFKTNKYKTVFVAVTEIDNHCHSVTVGVGLLASETIESYTSLLKILLNSFGSAPNVVVTDQDPAMKQAIASVFSNTSLNDERFTSVSWWEPIYEKCQAIMVEFELDKNKWLTDMYEIRFDWIPAFYKYEPLSGLMRTTSRSESENHFFGQATNSQLTVVEFFNHFDFCMEIQRYNGRRCDHDSSSCEEEGGYLRCKIWNFNAYVPGFLEVVFKDGEFGEESTATCSCKRFEQYGLLCRHIFYVMNMYQVKKFPKRYINDRWRKEVVVNIRTVPMSEFDIDELIKVRDKMNLMIEKADLTRYERVCPSKRDRFAAVLCFEQPSEVTIRVPNGIRNNGRGSHKRIKSKKEIAVSRSVKSYRECHICHQLGHNIRTCKALQQQPQQ